MTVERRTSPLFLAIVAFIISCAGFHFRVKAYPDGAGACASGPAIGPASGGIHGQDSSGSLSDGNLNIKIGDVALRERGGNLIAAGTTLPIELTGVQGTIQIFKGFLYRLSSATSEQLMNPTGIFTVTDSDNSQLLESTGESTGIPATCALNVAGLTHRNGMMYKSSVAANFEYPAAADLLLEVTVVRTTEQDWYYSAYSITLVDAANSVSTLAPSPTSTVANTSYPTMAATMFPTMMDSAIQSNFIFGDMNFTNTSIPSYLTSSNTTSPTITPTIVSHSPTNSSTLVDTFMSTAMPTAVPTVTETKNPTMMNTGAPPVLNVIVSTDSAKISMLTASTIDDMLRASSQDTNGSFSFADTTTLVTSLILLGLGWVIL